MLLNTDIIVGLRGNSNYQFPIVGIGDSNGGKLFTWSQPTGPGLAVNYINVLSAFTLNTPVLSAQGSDTNVNLGIQGQGTGYVDFLGTGAISLPDGTTGQRPAAITGGLRYNSTTDFPEYYSISNSAWESIPATSGIVTSITGTTHQITASAATGAVTLSIPSTFIAPGTLAAVTSVSSPSYLLTGATDGIISILGQAHAGTYNFNLPTTAGTSGYVLTSAGGVASPMTWTNLATSAVTSIAGTANEITASAATGAVTLSTPATFIAPGTIAAVTSISSPLYLLTGSTDGVISILGQAHAGTFNFNLPVTAGTSGYVLTSAGGVASPMTWTNLSTATVTSIAGTANQITASASTGAVTLSIPSTFIAPGSIAATTTISGTTFNSSTLTASTAIASDGSKNLVSSSTTATELGYVHGVTSAIQTQFTNKITVTSAEVYAADSGAANAYVVTLSPVPLGYTAGMVVNFLATNANTTTSTVNVNGLGAKTIKKFATTNLAANDILASEMVTVIYDGANFQLSNPPQSAAGGGTVTSVATGTGLSGGTITSTGTINLSTTNAMSHRLTLTTNVPVTTTDVTAATTLYLTPYKGTDIDIYSGSAWVRFQQAQLSITNAGLSASTPYDVFIQYNSGTPQLSLTAWTNGTTRATALAYQNGVLVLSGTTTSRYLGTVVTDGSTKFNDAIVLRYLWNYYNRTLRTMYYQETTSAWSYNSSSYAPMNGVSADALFCVVGVVEDCIDVICLASALSAAFAEVGIGINSASVNSAILSTITAASAVCPVQAFYKGLPTLGQQYYQALQAGSTATFYGGAAGTCAAGINGTLLM